MNTCATCRFMAAERDCEGWGTEHRTCVRVIHGNGGAWNAGKGQPAAVLDGSGYAARLVVLPTFGCVLHEPRSDDDARR